MYVYVDTHPEHEVGNLGEEERGQLQRRGVLLGEEVALLRQLLVGPGRPVVSCGVVWCRVVRCGAYIDCARFAVVWGQLLTAWFLLLPLLRSPSRPALLPLRLFLLLGLPTLEYE